MCCLAVLPWGAAALIAGGAPAEVPATCAQGQSKLNGRGFDDAVVEASFYDERAFARLRLL